MVLGQAIKYTVCVIMILQTDYIQSVCSMVVVCSIGMLT